MARVPARTGAPGGVFARPRAPAPPPGGRFCRPLRLLALSLRAVWLVRGLPRRRGHAPPPRTAGLDQARESEARFRSELEHSDELAIAASATAWRAF